MLQEKTQDCYKWRWTTPICYKHMQLNPSPTAILDGRTCEKNGYEDTSDGAAETSPNKLLMINCDT